MTVTRREQRLLVALAALLHAPSAVGAPMDNVQSLVTNPVTVAHVLDSAGRSAVMVQNPCPSATYKALGVYRPVAPFTFDPKGIAASGAWTNEIEMNGCGLTRLLNVLAVIQPPGTLNTIPLLPGTTHASTILQKDAVKFAAMAANAAGHELGCNVGYVENTQFLEYDKEAPPNGAKGKIWREKWTLDTCTHRIIVPMEFIPATPGTQVIAAPALVGPKP